jgi:predicted HTH transcriptional regulator
MDRERLVRELLYQIRLGEDSQYEFKRVHIDAGTIRGPKQNDIAAELAAFANAKGGALVLGVDDKTRDVTGIPTESLDAVQGLLTRACQDNIDPPLYIFTRLVELPNHQGEMNPVIYVRVDKSLYVHSSNGRYYHRVNESKKEMPPDYLARLMMQRSQARMVWFDEQPVPGTGETDLDAALVKRFTRETQPMAGQLRKLKLIVKDEEGNECLSVAGVLMATANPAQWLPQAYIQAVCYSGERRDADQQRDAQDITGPLDRQVMQALAFIERNMKTAATKSIGRRDIPQYSLKSLFEALVNAVAHRDYAIYGGKIRLHLFADRLVIASPGALVNTMEVDELELRQATRNQLITTLLARCPVELAAVERSLMMDKRGEGVPLVLDESERLSGKRPTYQMVGEELQLTIYAAEKETDV